MRFIIIITIFLGLLVGCASKPPLKQQNICSIFEQKYSWYKIVNKSEEKWGAPIHVQMAILRQESAFQNRVKPERTKLFGIIPWKRKSSSFGYTQAIDATWEWYRQENKKPLASRVNFADAVDFVGWYNYKTHKQLGISLTNARALYLAYHEGRGGYKRGSYRTKPWLLSVADKVQRQSDRYKAQYQGCKKRLGKRFIFF